MYIKPFKLKHLRALYDILPVATMPNVPRIGWVVIEHEEILAVGFFREVEGGMMAVEGPYPKPDHRRSKEAGELLEKLFMVEAMDRGVDLVRIKAYRP